MEFENYDMCDVIKAFMKLFIDKNECYRDLYNRHCSGTVIYWNDDSRYINIKTNNFHELFINELIKRIDTLYSIGGDNKKTILKFSNCNIMLNYNSDYGESGNITTFNFTLLDDVKDIRICSMFNSI